MKFVGLKMQLVPLVLASLPNMALNLAPFGRWTALKRRRLALR